MSINSSQFLIRDLLANLAHGQPFGLQELAAHQVSPALAAKYVSSGWLERLAHGVYAFPNDTLQLDACLLFLQKQVHGFHVGGKTALDWQGIRHNISSRAKIQLWGEQRYNVPDWFSVRFPARYFHRTLFDATGLQNRLADEGYAELADHATGLRVSCRERALLEMLNEVGVTQDLEEATNLFENFTSLRLDVMGALLESCERVKTVRLFLSLAERTGVLDVNVLQANYNLPLGSNARWSRRLQDGTLLTLKKPC
jgi:hypothetical protein